MELARRGTGARDGDLLQVADGVAVSDLPGFIGFCCFAAAMQLYDDVAVLGNVGIFNAVLVSALAYLVASVAFVAVGLLSDWRPPRAVAIAGALASAAGMGAAALAGGGAVGVPAAVVGGAGMACLSVCWASFLASRAPETLCLRVIAGLLVGSAVSFVLFAANVEALVEACLVVLAIMSCLPWLAPDEGAPGDGARDGAGGTREGVAGGAVAPGDAAGPAGERGAAARGAASAAFPFGISASLLVTLAVCCLLSAFFSGVTMNPFGMQSKSIDAYLHLVATSVFFLLAIDCIASKAVHLWAFVLGAMAVLLTGLLLLTTGLGGGLVVPIGLILAMRSLSWGLSWVVLAAIVSARPRRVVAVAALFQVVCGAALGRGAGVLLRQADVVGFSGLATFGIVCITLVAVAYALMNVSKLAHVRVPVGFDLRDKAPVAPIRSEARPLDGGATGAAPSPGEPAGQAPVSSGEAAPGELAGQGPASPAGGTAGEPVGSDAAFRVKGAPDSTGILAGAAAPELVHIVSFEGIGLTDKETEVATLLLQGLVYADVAEEMGVSLSTVKYHAKNIFQKADVETKREFVVKYADASR